MARVLGGLLLCGAGVLTGVPAVAVHQRWWGLALGLAAAVSFLAAAPAGWRRAAFAAGWAGTVWLLAPQRPEGDLVLPATLPGYVLLAATVAFVVVALVTIPPRGRRDDPGPGGSAT